MGQEETPQWDLENLISHPRSSILDEFWINKKSFFEKMKKILPEKVFAFSLVLIVFIVVIWFYQQGKIGFLPQKKSTQIEKKVVEILFREKEYKLSYKDKFPSAVIGIARFEEDENWQGDGDIDFTDFYEGETSFRLVSQDNKKATLSLFKDLNLEEALNFKFLIKLETDFNGCESLNIIFGNKDLSSSYRYSIRDLTKGWNLVTLPKENFTPSVKKTIVSTATLEEGSIEEAPIEETAFNWGNIQKVAIELVSRPKNVTSANFDFLWAETKDNYHQDWNTVSDKFLSLGENGESTNLLVVHLAASTASIKRISSAKDYTVQAKFTPLKTGGFGFFLRNDFTTNYGYYLMMGGVGTNTWSIYKVGFFKDKSQAQNLALAEGSIANFKIEKNKTYLLKSELSGSRITFYLSLDDKNLTKLGEARDDSFSSGGVGIAANGGSIFLVDDIAFFQ